MILQFKSFLKNLKKSIVIFKIFLIPNHYRAWTEFINSIILRNITELMLRHGEKKLIIILSFTHRRKFVRKRSKKEQHSLQYLDNLCILRFRMVCGGQCWRPYNDTDHWGRRGRGSDWSRLSSLRDRGIKSFRK